MKCNVNKMLFFWHTRLTYNLALSLSFFQVWFKNRRAKWRKQKREEQERLRKLQDEHNGGNSGSITSIKTEDMPSPVLPLSTSIHNFSDAEDSSDLEVA